MIQTDVRIECIGPEHAGTFASIACTAFDFPEALRPWLAAGVGHPGWRHYLGWDGEEPVAAGALLVRGRVGWLVGGCTLESHRRRGAQGAMMMQRIRDSVELGCHWLITETREANVASYHNMLRTGFELAYQRPNYMFATATSYH